MNFKQGFFVFFGLVSCSVFGGDFESAYCSSLRGELNKDGFDYKDHLPLGYLRRNVLVGGSALKYDRESFYLWVSRFDINSDGADDLVAIDMAPRNTGQYYFGMYVFEGEGGIYSDNKLLRFFLSQKKIATRHGYGEIPVFKEILDEPVVRVKGVDEYFVGYVLNPVFFEGKTVLVAEKEKGSSVSWIVYEFKEDVHAPVIVCAWVDKV